METMKVIANCFSILISIKKCIFAVALAMVIAWIIFLRASEFWLENFQFFIVLIITLFFVILSILTILELVFGFARNCKHNYSYQKSIENREIEKMKNLELDEKAFLFSLIKIDKNKIDISELDINNNDVFCQLLSKNIIQEKWQSKFFMVKPEIWHLLQKHKKKIFCEKEFQQNNEK